MAEKLYRIEYLGEVLETNHFAEISDAKCEELRQAYYRKPSIDAVHKNLASIRRGGTQVATITEYYVKDLMSQTKLYSPRWTIAEVFECNDLIRYFYSRICASEKVYPKSKTEIENIETALRISGGGVAMKPSNFPMPTVDAVLAKYNLNNRYYDFSCGWGVRLLSALKNRVAYFGTDPNYELVARLKQIHQDYDLVNSTISSVDIRATGSEVFHPDWENTMGVAFSSPPYFDLEDYRIGAQSIRGRDYRGWLGEYLQPTIDNIKRYLVPGGHIIVNIKNYGDYALYDDTFSLCESSGLTYVETLILANITRPSAKQDINTDEKIMVFRHGDTEKSSPLDLFVF
jgi:hypothetical protein